jgi:hypothetical protein
MRYATFWMDPVCLSGTERRKHMPISMSGYIQCSPGIDSVRKDPNQIIGDYQTV